MQTAVTETAHLVSSFTPCFKNAFIFLKSTQEHIQNRGSWSTGRCAPGGFLYNHKNWTTAVDELRFLLFKTALQKCRPHRQLGSESFNIGIIADPGVAAEGGYSRWCRHRQQLHRLSSSVLGRHPRFALFHLSHIRHAHRAMLFVMAALQRCCVLICSGDDSPSMRRSGLCAPLFVFATPMNAFI